MNTERIRHFHMPEMKVPAITFFIKEETTPEKVHILKMSWAICAAEDNFSRKEGVKQAKNNMSHGVCVQGIRDSNLTMKEQILHTLTYGYFALEDPTIQSPRKDPRRFRKQAIQTMEDFYVTEDDVSGGKQAKPKKSLYYDRILPTVFRSKFMRKAFWGTN